MRFQPVPHYIPANAVEFACDGARFTFGADCGPSEDLARFAAGTDLLMVEATLLEPEPPDDRGHLTPFEAGEHAAHAGAKRLVLTHYADEAGVDWVCDRGGARLRRAGRSGPRRFDLHARRVKIS